MTTFYKTCAHWTDETTMYGVTIPSYASGIASGNHVETMLPTMSVESAR